ncbi:MAG: glycosyltransferase family 9 protein [Turneriella sp.]|nr:glycosyltransferase family 9 protein [Turneriella sp.]
MKLNDKKILLIRHGALGDCLLITPFIRLLKKQYPESQIDIYSLLDLFRYYPEVRQWVDAKQVELAKIIGRYDAVYAFCYEHAPQQHILDGYEYSSGLKLNSDVPFVPDANSYLMSKTKIRWEKLCKKYIVVTPFSGLESRNLPLHKVHETLKALKTHFSQFERLVFHHARMTIPDAINIYDQQSFPEMVYIMRHAAACITVDTGFFHLAQACGVPTVLIAGSTDPRLRITRPELCFVVQAKLPCLGCYHRHIGTFGTSFTDCFRGDFACNNDFSVEEIVQKLRLALGGKRNRNNPTLRHSKERAMAFRRLERYGDLTRQNILRHYFHMVQVSHEWHKSSRARWLEYRQKIRTLAKKILRRIAS